jgi:N6-L-threonylcarbamoyladenine synthase
MKLILACESTCDETAFCVFDLENEIVLSQVVRSQIRHAKFGGVVPEIASEEHLFVIDLLCKSVLDDANIKIENIDFFAVANKPGLPGALLIGNCFMKALAWSFKKPLIPIDHLAGHIYSVFIDNDLIFPNLCLSASGGHSSIYEVCDEETFFQLRTTVDDAAGECFDKISNLLGLGYPGGAKIEEFAEKNNFHDQFKFPRLKNKDGNLSFSGLKSAVLRTIIADGYYDKDNKKIKNETPEKYILNVCSSLLCSISDILCNQIENVLQAEDKYLALALVGGVACNNYLKLKLKKIANENGLKFLVPDKKYCTDNAVMIAKVASLLIKKETINMDIFYKSDIFS